MEADKAHLVPSRHSRVSLEPPEVTTAPNKDADKDDDKTANDDSIEVVLLPPAPTFPSHKAAPVTADKNPVVHTASKADDNDTENTGVPPPTPKTTAPLKIQE